MVSVSNFKTLINFLTSLSQNWVKNWSILGEYVSPVIRRSLSNFTGNLKKAVRIWYYFLNTFILEFWSLEVPHYVKTWSERFKPVFCLSMVIKRIQVNSNYLHNTYITYITKKIVKKRKILRQVSSYELVFFKDK